MLRAAFHSRTVRNALAPEAPVAHTVHAPSGEIMPIWDAAERYSKEGDSVVIVAGERYGTGSSRDWAAKGQRLLGVRAVLASSFERIHRSNLIGMGILPLRIARPMEMAPGDQIEIDATAGNLQPRVAVAVTVIRANGTREPVNAVAAVETRFEVELLRDGGVLPHILRNATEKLTSQGKAA
jgi:aconitate hydratase